MKQIFLNNARLVALLLGTAGALTACDEDSDDVSPPKSDLVFQALSDNNQLLQMNANNVGSAPTPLAITGLQSGEKIMSIDYRPATGQLYGLGSTSRLYVINPTTGAARMIGSGAFTPAINGTTATIDFNPTVDRIRLVTSSGQNLRLNPETGTVAATDGNINGVASAMVSAVAYTNSMAGASSTTLFDIDPATDKLYRQDPPNDGTLVPIGDLGVNATGMAGFDIGGNGNEAFAALTVDNRSGLYKIDLASGKATRYDDFSSNIIGVAIPTQAVAYGVDADNNFVAFNPTSPLMQVAKPITGVQTGERIVGIDMRPANGQLYGLGSTNRLYTINLATGAATAVGAGVPLPLTGTEFGFDFNPTVDRIRIISNTGINLRVNPADGVAIVDGPLNPGTPNVTAAAYTNNFAGATSTVLFDIDSNTDMLYRQDPPNAGTLVSIGALGVNTTGVNGFDIGGTSGTGFAVLTVGTTASVYTINLTSGAATKGADLPKPLQAMAVGLGF
ncbi:DUF4394 domain-containing protein [Hymenobacter wooponensis]|uniref:DUF4394 domain-containing protein n=1 Tax=Hymenobacter wooponensis TaxID=1525360 RepID=A0A4Z0MVR1_9BACT|nr:DUF4394 domain-containing protein [Hymenobacter wooponensis]TGD83307.1 DUF4394 domain-containing protein [Hymenobacter wooponensis]